MDVSPRLEHELSLVATVKTLIRMLCRYRADNLRWREYDTLLFSENRWCAQRDGVANGLISAKA